MTPLSPDRSDEVRRSITAAYRLKRRAQLEAMQAEIRDLTATIKACGLRLSLLAGQVNVMLLELRADETTRRIPILPEAKPLSPASQVASPRAGPALPPKP